MWTPTRVVGPGERVSETVKDTSQSGSGDRSVIKSGIVSSSSPFHF